MTDSDAGYRERRRRKKAERLYWKLRDARADHSSWSFGRSPSENHRNEQRIAKLEAVLEAMGGHTDDQ